MNQPAFIPSTQELAGLARDLKFHPCGVRNPRALTGQQIAVFNRDGYLKGIRIFSEASRFATARPTCTLVSAGTRRA